MGRFRKCFVASVGLLVAGSGTAMANATTAQSAGVGQGCDVGAATSVVHVGCGADVLGVGGAGGAVELATGSNPGVGAGVDAGTDDGTIDVGALAGGYLGNPSVVRACTGINSGNLTVLGVGGRVATNVARTQVIVNAAAAGLPVGVVVDTKYGAQLQLFVPNGCP